MKLPKVSVVMPVYNREKYIKESIDSILNQTFKDFELIIIDDGSTDDSLRLIQQYDDFRIKLIKHDNNLGVASARNTGYLHSKGEYIVIADSDDINHPDKLLEQVNVLDNCENIDIVGCYYQHFSDKGDLEILKYPEEDMLIKAYSVFWLFQAPASMFRKDKIKNKGTLLHDESYLAAVDIEWFSKQPLNINFTNIPKVLYYYRRHNDQLTLDNSFSIQKKFISKSRVELLKSKLGIDMSEQRVQLHNLLCDPFLGDIQIQEINNWVELLIESNNTKVVFDLEIFTKLVLTFYRNLCQWFGESPKGLSKYLNELKYFKLDSIFQFRDINEELICKYENSNIAILGTLCLGRKIKYKLKNELNLDVKFYIDNYRYTRITQLDDLHIFSSEILNTEEIDTIFISIESEARWDVLNDLKHRFPDKTILTIDEFLCEI